MAIIMLYTGDDGQSHMEELDPGACLRSPKTRNTVRYNLAVIAEPCVRLLCTVTSLHKAQQWGRSNTSETGSLLRLPVQRASY